MTTQIAITLSIIVGALLLFGTEKLRVDVVALLVLLAVALTGLVGHLILGSEGNHAGDQQVKRRSLGVLNLGQRGHPAGGSEGVEPTLEVADSIGFPVRVSEGLWARRHPPMMIVGLVMVKPAGNSG